MSSYSEGQTHQLMDALEAAGYTPADVTRLGQFDDLPGIRGVLHGRSKIVVVKHTIDLDAAPFVPDGWTIEEHVKGGQFEWDPAKVIPYLSPDQEAGQVVSGDNLREHLKTKPVFNANLLDYLLANPQIIPETIKSKLLFFWGTIYRDSGGRLYVRCLSWGGGRWRWRYGRLDYGWNSDHPAAVSASPRTT